MKSRLLLILVIAVFAQAKTMAADTMSPQVFRDTVIVQSDSVSHHHRCVIKISLLTLKIFQNQLKY